MPRTARACVAGYCYHVLNRGNAGSEVFHQPGDYAAFLQTLGEASVRLPMPLLAYCLMPNHSHAGRAPGIYSPVDRTESRPQFSSGAP